MRKFLYDATSVNSSSELICISEVCLWYHHRDQTSLLDFAWRSGNLNNNNNSNNKNASLCLYLVNSLTDALFLKYWSLVLFALFQDFVMRGERGILFLFRFCIWIKHQSIEFYLQLFYQTVRTKEKNIIEKADFSTKL